MKTNNANTKYIWKIDDLDPILIAKIIQWLSVANDVNQDKNYREECRNKISANSTTLESFRSHEKALAQKGLLLEVINRCFVVSGNYSSLHHEIKCGNIGGIFK